MIRKQETILKQKHFIKINHNNFQITKRLVSFVKI
jgi:hypothetical protein